jgi:hypothetical protein
MYFKKISISILLLLSSIAHAAEPSTIELFYSNNTSQVDLQAAYQRLTGAAEQALESNSLELMKAYHLQHGKQEEVLGTYYLSHDHKTTMDNSEIFSLSPSQRLPKERIFAIAKKIAMTFNQESVAVFIPSYDKIIADIKVTFTNEKPKINDVIKMIHERLPESYSQAFTLHIKDKTVDYAHAEVNAVEWLGNKLKMDLFKQAFPQANVSYHYGQSYLIYKNGNIDAL